jgi:hypothetical protein
VADKYLFIDLTTGHFVEREGTVVSVGSGSAGKIVALDANGRADPSIMPVGIGPDTQSITTSEALAAGDLVNIHNSTGAKARKADAATGGKPAHGFVLQSFGSGVAATVYFEGTIVGLTGLTPGTNFLSTTAGAATATPPSASGNAVQKVGVATSPTTLNFEPGPVVVLA